MVAKPVTGHSVFSRALLAPGDVSIGTHSARGRHSTCAMAPKPMEYEITDGRRGDETLAQQSPRESSRVRGGLLTVILGTNLPMTPITRQAAHRQVAALMRTASIDGPQACPRGLRHAFGVAAVQAGVPLTTIAAVLGHADVSTTAIYATATGAEARALVSRVWT